MAGLVDEGGAGGGAAQTLSLLERALSISDGNTINLPSDTDKKFRVGLTAAQSLSSGVSTIEFDEVEFDEDDLVDLTTGKFTVPANFPSHGILIFNQAFSTDSDGYVYIKRDRGGTVTTRAQSRQNRPTLTSGIVEFVEGDIWFCDVFMSAANSASSGNQTSFSMVTL